MNTLHSAFRSAPSPGAVGCTAPAGAPCVGPENTQIAAAAGGASGTP